LETVVAILLSHWGQVFVGSHGVLTLHMSTARTFWRCVFNDFIKKFMWHDKL